jgi:hypothetical protein
LYALRHLKAFIFYSINEFQITSLHKRCQNYTNYPVSIHTHDGNATHKGKHPQELHSKNRLIQYTYIFSPTALFRLKKKGHTNTKSVFTDAFAEAHRGAVVHKQLHSNKDACRLFIDFSFMEFLAFSMPVLRVIKLDAFV